MHHFILLYVASILFAQTTATFHFELLDGQSAKDYTSQADSSTQLSNEISSFSYEINSGSSEVRSDSISPTSNQNLSSKESTNGVDNMTTISGNSNVKSETNTETHSSSSHGAEVFTKALVNDSSSNQPDSFSKSTTTSDKFEDGANSTTATNTTNAGNITSTSSEAEDDAEEVVIVKPTTQTGNDTYVTSRLRILYKRTLELISDTYTLSILLPVAAGIVFASTIIITIATCRCLKRRCRRNRFRRKVLPDSVKNLRPSDQARLLAETSDEEF